MPLLRLALTALLLAVGVAPATGAVTRLAQRPFVPTDYSFFRFTAAPALSPLASPALAPGPSDADVRAQIQEVLGNRRRGPEAAAANAALVQSGLALYDRPDVVAKLPDAVLRGAYVLLLGTVGEPTMAPLLTDAAGTIAFAPQPPGTESGIAAASASGRVTVNEAFRYEQPVVLSATLAHEALHLGPGTPFSRNSLDEEVISAAVEAVVTIEQVLVVPRHYRQQTELVQRIATSSILARLNSGTGESIRIVSPGSVLFPGRPRAALTDFRSLISADYAMFRLPATSEGIPTLTAVVARLTPPGRTAPASPAFDDALIAHLDAGLNPDVLTAADLVAVANALSLEGSTPPAPCSTLGGARKKACLLARRDAATRAACLRSRGFARVRCLAVLRRAQALRVCATRTGRAKALCISDAPRIPAPPRGVRARANR